MWSCVVVLTFALAFVLSSTSFAGALLDTALIPPSGVISTGIAVKDSIDEIRDSCRAELITVCIDGRIAKSAWAIAADVICVVVAGVAEVMLLDRVGVAPKKLAAVEVMVPAGALISMAPPAGTVFVAVGVITMLPPLLVKLRLLAAIAEVWMRLL